MATIPMMPPMVAAECDAPHTVCNISVNDGKNDEQKGDHSGGLVSGRSGGNAETAVTHEGSCNDIDKGCDNEDQYQQCKDREELLGSFSHGIADDLTYGFSVVAKGCEQGTEVLQAAKEDSADDAP